MVTPLLFALLLPNPATTAGWAASALTLAQGVESDGPPGSSFRYDYVEAALAFGELDGLRLGGSLHIEGSWIALARFEYLTEDEGSTDVDLLLLGGGVGYVHPVEQNLDVIGSAEVEVGEAEVDGPNRSEDDDDAGLRLRAGARFQATEQLELAGGLSWSTIFDEDLGADAMALYAFGQDLSGLLGIEFRDDTFAVLGVRFGF